jgi:hypothetical protein
MNVDIELTNGKRIMHIVMEGEEIIAFDHLLNRALNTMDPQKAQKWIALEGQIDAFIRTNPNGNVSAA